MNTRNISGGLKAALPLYLPLSCADCREIWEPQPPGIQRACPGLYGDCFTLPECYSVWYMHFARSEARICCRSLAGISGSNPAWGIYVLSLVLSGRGLCDGSISRPDEFYRLCDTGCDKVKQ